MVTRFDQHGLEATPEQLLDEKLGGKSKFKQAFLALSVHYYLQKFDQEDGMQNLKTQELLNILMGGNLKILMKMLMSSLKMLTAVLIQ